jgi:fatty-acyl-CoA synthase
VIGANDPRRGETVRAYVVQASGATLTEDQLIRWCHGEMAAYKCPTSVVFTESLPKSGAGKVQWRELAEMDRARRETSVG